MSRTRVGVTTAALLALSLTLTAHEEGGPRGDRHRGLVCQSFDVRNATLTNAQGINSRGDIVGAYVKDRVTHGFLISAGVITTIDYPGAVYTDVRGINAHGEIVGNYKNAGEPPVNIHAMYAIGTCARLTAQVPPVPPRRPFQSDVLLNLHPP